MNEEDLIYRAREGSMQAFSELIDIYSPIVRRFAFQLGNHHDDIDDITQEVFVRVYRFLSQFSQAKFTTWLYKFTLNVTRDFARSNRRHMKKVWRFKNEPESSDQLVENSLLRSEDDRVLHECIQKLDEKYQVPIILFYFHEKRYEDIAEILSISLANVKTRLLRGKENLKKLLADAEKREGKYHG
ncbi:RNA polymerase sigma factor [Bacillus sp. T33-2]|uniref:RNA polymerase sigma factor n=1 Tax=Bacillus sp. T33-2 TaxID=2054168 RepID=UPI000C77C3DA|nr:RNA polymerase sigma factor [Bacillus sp. T33-2]PLR92674.1 RNA polymerase subunit sigma [Bacillus sp. T33-2]